MKTVVMIVVGIAVVAAAVFVFLNRKEIMARGEQVMAERKARKTASPVEVVE